MNKKQLIKYIKKYLSKDVIFNLELINKKVYFNLYGFDHREVCVIEINYKDRLDKRAIYVSIADLITHFDFSFRVFFDNMQDIYKFLKV